MIAYLEKFDINGRAYGIEKSSDGYSCWVGGCGIGKKASLPEAREKLHSYAINDLTREQASTVLRLDNIRAALASLGDDPFNLGRHKDDGE